ncbi:MAG: 50S ribosomal protein L6, partial [Candidatus Margulisiibacteriota bacterium]
MSRVGKSIIQIPKNVEVKLDQEFITVKGPKGTLKELIPALIEIKVKDGVLEVLRQSEAKAVKSLHGLLRMKIANMVKGVAEEYKKVLTIIGVGYRATQKGKDLEFALGYSHPIIIKSAEGIKLLVENQTKIV